MHVPILGTVVAFAGKVVVAVATLPGTLAGDVVNVVTSLVK